MFVRIKYTRVAVPPYPLNINQDACPAHAPHRPVIPLTPPPLVMLSCSGPPALQHHLCCIFIFNLRLQGASHR
jgi:hypothetical protein